MNEYEKLIKEIESLIIIIGDGVAVDNEVCHQLEDEFKDKFINMVCSGVVPYHQIKSLAYKLDEIPDYTK